MPPRKKNTRSNRRGTSAARKPQPSARLDGGPPASPGTAAPQAPGPRAANPSTGVSSGTASPPGVASAGNVPAGLTRVAKVPPGLTPAGPASMAPRAQGISVRTHDTTPARPPAAAEESPEPAEKSDDLPSWAAKAVEELLTPTYWLDPGEQGEPFSATIRFSGQRVGVTGRPHPGDTFSVDETVEGIVPGSGPVAITAEVRGVNQGEWTVTARPVGRVGSRPYRGYPAAGENPADSPRVPRPRHVVVPADPGAHLRTARLLRTKVPGIVRFAYATLVSLGVLVGLGLEALLLSRGHYSLLRPMLYSVLAIVAGVIGGKAWYVAVHKGRKFDGWCIQGFVAGAAVVVAAAALAGPGIPAGAYLAAAAPALLIGMSIGRPGCFWAGCCTGRPTAARWGIWSSDRRLGCRRAPAQLLEALAALVSGLAVLIVVLVEGLARSGPAGVVGLAVYTLCRQAILGLRAEPRMWRYGRPVTAAVAAIALIVGIVLLARG
jgi:phosphatidylglycerol---prolipoprotein diacylglyceryl transferase